MLRTYIQCNPDSNSNPIFLLHKDLDPGPGFCMIKNIRIVQKTENSLSFYFLKPFIYFRPVERFLSFRRSLNDLGKLKKLIIFFFSSCIRSYFDCPRSGSADTYPDSLRIRIHITLWQTATCLLGRPCCPDTG